MNTKEFYYWLSGYMSGLYNEESETTPDKAFEEIQEKLKEVVVERDEKPFRNVDIKDYPIQNPFNPLKAPNTGDPLPKHHPTIGDPLPGQDTTIICKNDKTKN